MGCSALLPHLFCAPSPPLRGRCPTKEGGGGLDMRGFLRRPHPSSAAPNPPSPLGRGRSARGDHRNKSKTSHLCVNGAPSPPLRGGCLRSRRRGSWSALMCQKPPSVSLRSTPPPPGAGEARRTGRGRSARGDHRNKSKTSHLCVNGAPSPPLRGRCPTEEGGGGLLRERGCRGDFPCIGNHTRKTEKMI